MLTLSTVISVLKSAIFEEWQPLIISPADAIID